MEKTNYRKYVHNHHIRNVHHEMSSGKVMRRAKNSFDDKRRYIDKIESSPWTMIKKF